jgi:hypothetical protein
MYQITAAIFMPLPTMDTVLAMKTSRSGLCCRIERIAPHLAHCNRKSAGLPTRELRIIRDSCVKCAGDAQLSAVLAPLWRDPGFARETASNDQPVQGADRSGLGSSFWMRTT